MQGPRLKVEMSCFDCDYCVGESYRCQGDSGTDVYCIHPSMADTVATPRKLIGDTNWSTPAWCPFRQQAIENMARGLLGETV